MSPKVEIMEGEEDWAHSLARNTSRVEWCVGVSRWGLGILTSNLITYRTYTNQTTNWLMHNYNILVHGQTIGKHGVTKPTMTRT